VKQNRDKVEKIDPTTQIQADFEETEGYRHLAKNTAFLVETRSGESRIVPSLAERL
jgi:hypothetical protein